MAIHARDSPYRFTLSLLFSSPFPPSSFIEHLNPSLSPSPYLPTQSPLPTYLPAQSPSPPTCTIPLPTYQFLPTYPILTYFLIPPPHLLTQSPLPPYISIPSSHLPTQSPFLLTYQSPFPT